MTLLPTLAEATTTSGVLDLGQLGISGIIVAGLLYALRKISKERDDLFQRVLDQQQELIPLAVALKDAIAKLGERVGQNSGP